MAKQTNQPIEDISTLKLMWQLTRPHTLTATFAPVILGTMLALNDGPINWLLFTAMLVCGLFLQIATNLFNEYYDFKRGLDTVDSVGIGGALVRHGTKPSSVLAFALILYGLSVLIGIYICMNSSWWLVVIGIIGMLIGYLYTGGPMPIAYTPFGELFAGLSMGIGFILIAYFIQTGDVSMTSFLVSVPLGILVGGINMSNNIRDIKEDTIGGRKTLAILLGREKAIQLLAISFIVSYAWIVGLVVFGVVSPWLLLVFISVPKPIAAIKNFKEGEGIPMKQGLAMKSTALTNTFFGFLLSIGLIIEYLIK
ncbi:MAG: 1,4-dihydroxy-2-naphthoate polyprenyltransferase [Kurthia gibsonii]|uniref:1,4-dihydroxy-2-naphthoate octaprenyltransferase n=1 Tax=Kurthia gibsonii TaxID=33946 RepID=A0ABU9LKL5_9BACL|nr:MULTISPECIES: 1,4-dihydroxy-2-naphthoate polyprenyltransferase [Kurthia]AMA64422.1 1,4-dihydroxy-2-naphthoate octaprenyltransferase [Kurthia sp. 11kri321]MEB7772897.1 1,4-dihydroxy-2-naphthoate polyprenyltransferase [Kurthia gibsonii]RXH52013.1 1,4-dihydroxy-2-naphthoate polyprenyltransferase [Kurthia gibsonii]WIL38371.1 1,4-dihydroxy-2-naphthoate polyprenyltransferase [Kurthia sp. YJT4]HZG11065.1 1,4-dihydroxy-2-naphthoate polyprenyltransferase [Kurthia gibsonii]